MHNIRPLILGFGCAVAIAACASRADETYTNTAQGTVDLAPTMRVDDVEFGRALKPDSNVVSEMDSFAPTDTIWAAVRTIGADSGVKLTARWTYQDTSIVHEETRTISRTTDGFTAFRFAKPAPLATGNYIMIVLLNGRQVDDEDFVIR